MTRSWGCSVAATRARSTARLFVTASGSGGASRIASRSSTTILSNDNAAGRPSDALRQRSTASYRTPQASPGSLTTPRSFAYSLAPGSSRHHLRHLAHPDRLDAQRAGALAQARRPCRRAPGTGPHALHGPRARREARAATAGHPDARGTSSARRRGQPPRIPQGHKRRNRRRPRRGRPHAARGLDVPAGARQAARVWGAHRDSKKEFDVRDTQHYGCVVAELTEIISLRLSKADKKLLVRVAAKQPAATRLAVARLAMRLGLEQLDKRSPR